MRRDTQLAASVPGDSSANCFAGRAGSHTCVTALVPRSHSATSHHFLPLALSWGLSQRGSAVVVCCLPLALGHCLPSSSCGTWREASRGTAPVAVESQSCFISAIITPFSFLGGRKRRCGGEEGSVRLSEGVWTTSYCRETSCCRKCLITVWFGP